MIINKKALHVTNKSCFFVFVNLINKQLNPAAYCITLLKEIFNTEYNEYTKDYDRRRIGRSLCRW
jgi:hypothetical protein